MPSISISRNSPADVAYPCAPLPPIGLSQVFGSGAATRHKKAGFLQSGDNHSNENCELYSEA